MKTNKYLYLLILIAISFGLTGCEDEITEEVLSYYDLIVSPESHTFTSDGGEIDLEIKATKTSVSYKGNSKTGSVTEDVPYTINISGEGFSMDGNKVVAAENKGGQRFGSITITIDGAESQDDSDTQKVIELTQEAKERADGSILSFSFKDIEADVNIIDYAILVTVPGNVDITNLVPVIELSTDTKFVDYVPNTPLDFTNAVDIKIVGENEVIHSYTVTVTKENIPLGFSEVVKKFTLLQTQIKAPFNIANQLVSMAVSGDRIVLKTANVDGKNDIMGYNALTGGYEYSTNTHYGINRLGTDSQGRIIGTNLGYTGGKMYLFKLETLESSRETYFDNAYSGQGTWGNGGAVNIYGDITKDAVIFAPVARNGQKPAVYRFVVENGTLTSTSPELLVYGDYMIPDQPRYKPFGNVGIGIPAGPKAEDGYVFGDREEFSYFVNGKQYPFRYADAGQWAYGGYGGGKVFDMNGKKYLAIWRTISSKAGQFNILDITNPEAITMTAEQRESAGINFVVYQSERFEVVLGDNGSHFGNIDIKYLDNGNVMLYFMHGNSGVEAYELIKSK